jgi:hypothetical protein
LACSFLQLLRLAAAIRFPPAFVIRFMRQDMSDQDLTPSSWNDDNQSILISAHIKNHALTHEIGAGKRRLDVRKSTPARPFCNLMPGDKRFLRIGMFFPKLSKSLFRDNVHKRRPPSHRAYTREQYFANCEII